MEHTNDDRIQDWENMLGTKVSGLSESHKQRYLYEMCFEELRQENEKLKAELILVSALAKAAPNPKSVRFCSCGLALQR